MAKQKRRRGHGEGAIYQRADGRWAASISMGFDLDGKRIRKTLYGKTRKEVADKLRDVQLEIQRTGQFLEPSTLALGTYLAEWLETVKTTRRNNTYVAYEQVVRLHINPEIGRVPLSKLTPLHIQRLYTAKLNAGLSPNYIRSMHTVINLALRQAMQWQLIPSNPAQLVELPKADESRCSFLTPEQVQVFLIALKDHPYRAFFSTAVLTGLRMGELCGLSWADLDLDAATVTVSKNLTWPKAPGAGYVIGEPKTRHSKRIVPLPAALVAILRDHRRHQLEARLRTGAAWANAHDLVFTRPDGRPMDPKRIREHLDDILALCELPRIRFHDLRHTFASLLLYNGTHIKVVSALLGHSSVKISMDLYSHLIPGMETDAAKKLDSLFSAHL